MSAGFALVAPAAIVLLYGGQFAQPAVLIAAIGVLQMTRFIRLWPVTIALAIGRSGTVLLSNVVRLVAFPLALLAMDLGWGMIGLVSAFAMAEGASLLITMVAASRQSGLALKPGFARVAAYVLACIGWAYAAQHLLPWLCGVLALPTLFAIWWLFRQEKHVIMEARSMIRRSGAAA
jgi:O-antigen/teichoic acid export membrane protein